MKLKSNLNLILISMLWCELGLDLLPHQLKMIQHLIIKFDLDIKSATYSSGRSLIFIKDDKASACMEWKIIKGEGVYKKYLKHKVIGVTDIHNMVLIQTQLIL